MEDEVKRNRLNADVVGNLWVPAGPPLIAGPEIFNAATSMNKCSARSMRSLPGIQTTLTSPVYFDCLGDVEIAAWLAELRRWKQEQIDLGGRVEGGVWVYPGTAKTSKAG